MIGTEQGLGKFGVADRPASGHSVHGHKGFHQALGEGSDLLCIRSLYFHMVGNPQDIQPANHTNQQLGAFHRLGALDQAPAGSIRQIIRQHLVGLGRPAFIHGTEILIGLRMEPITLTSWR